MNLSIEYLNVKDLKPYENNARKHETKDIEAIMQSIKQFGFNDPIGIWSDQNIIVEGHGRLQAAKKLKMKSVPCIRLDSLTDEQRKAYALAHNKTAELSEWDFDKLEEELAGLDIDMSSFGFDVSDDDLPKDDDDEDDDPFDDVEKQEAHYGVPYQGNKSRIADIIISILPEGNRLVDLFGGGGAITHCAMLSGKWQSYLYNDINPMITGLFMDAVNGKYHDERRVITREDFNELKDTDAYVKYIWSFGNNGLAYLWGKDIEEIKCQACRSLMEKELRDRRLAYVGFVKMLNGNKVENINRLQSIEHLQALTQLEALQRLEVTNISYQDYEYQEGDIVYCDVPYEQIGKAKCDDYGVNFDSLAFYEWAKSRDYQVFFSSYEISDQTFYKVKVKTVHSLIGATTNSDTVNEYLYSNKPIKFE